MMHIDFNAVAVPHYLWIEKMGWHNKPILASMALVASEIGEAAAECIPEVTPAFGEELSDILLRLLDMSVSEKVSLTRMVPHLPKVTWKTSTTPERLAEMLIDYALWTNTVRKGEPDTEFPRLLATLVMRVISIAESCNIDIMAEVQKKMKKNNERGSRGRTI